MKKSEGGQGLVEYALILALVSIVTVAVLTLLGKNVGDVFERIECVIENDWEDEGCENEQDSASFGLQANSQFQLTTRTNKNGEIPTQLVALGNAAIKQEEKLHESVSAWEVGLNEMLTILIADAQAAGDEALAQSLLALQQEILAGNYDSLPDALAILNTAFADAPFDVQVALAETLSESSLSTCKTLAGATVSIELYQATVDVLNEREAEAPGSTEPVMSLAQGAWNEIIEPRNQVALQGGDSLATFLTVLITAFEATEAPELLKLAQHLHDKGDGCGTLPNSPPVVKTGLDHTVSANQSVNVMGRWNDPAGHLDEPYAWAWDLDGDGVWDSQGTSDYGPALVETISFAQPGSYTLTLMVTDKDGAADTNTVLITVVE